MLASLRHRTVVRADHQDRTVHLGGAGDHVLDIVGVARTIDVRVMTFGGLVLDVRDRDRDTALALLGRLVDLIEGDELGKLLRGQHLGNRRGQRCFAVVDMADRADVRMRLVSFKFSLAHDFVLRCTLPGLFRLSARRDSALSPLRAINSAYICCGTGS